MPGERTEQATPHRKEKARRDGDIVHSKELSAAAGTLAGIVALNLIRDRMLGEWRNDFMTVLLFSAPEHWEASHITSTLAALERLTMQFLRPVALVMLSVALASLGTAVIQTGGFSFYPTALFRAERVNPLTNLKNLFSLRAASRLAKSLIPVAILALIAARRIADQLRTPPFSIGRLADLGTAMYELVLAAGWLFFAWSVLDYVLEWRSRDSRLKMSREDVRQEYKETEGSPQIRSRIRGLQRQMRRRKMKADISKSAVVVTNPTHYAVALGFDFVAMHAPKVLAKGRNLRAEEIKSEARWAGIPIVENPPLARSLYKTVEEGQAIPEGLYAAVAAILAFLYRQHLEREKRHRDAGEGANG